MIKCSICSYNCLFSPIIGLTWEKKIQTKHATSMLSRSVGFRSDPPPKGGFWGGSVFLDFFHGFLRWGHKILHADSNGLSGPSGRILAGRMPFPATNRILNFIFLQKFLPFCPILTIFFFSEPKSSQMSQNFIRWFFRVKRTFRPNFGWPNPISGHQFYFEFWSILENSFFFFKNCK